MNAELEALARRAVACKGWRWMAGMRVVRPDGTFPLRIVQSGCLAHEGDLEPGWPPRVQVATGLHLHDIPDLTDPATLGCLLALVREALSDPYASTVWDPEADRWTIIGALDPEWGIRDIEPGRLLVGPTEAAALVAALEAAP